MSKPRLSSDLRQILEASGAPWRLETGRRHIKLFVGDRFVAILPKGHIAQHSANRGYRNFLASLRRALRPAAAAS